MIEQNAPSAGRSQRGNSQPAENKRRATGKYRPVNEIDPAKYMPALRAEAPRMLRFYGSIDGVADALKVRRKRALDLVLLALVERKPLQRRKGK